MQRCVDETVLLCAILTAVSIWGCLDSCNIFTPRSAKNKHNNNSNKKTWRKNLNSIKKTESSSGKYFRFHLSGKTVGFRPELYMYINSTHTEKSPHGDQPVSFVMITSLTAKWSLKVMRILEQCDYRPKVQWAITPFSGWVGWWWWWGLWWGGYL